MPCISKAQSISEPPQVHSLSSGQLPFGIGLLYPFKPAQSQIGCRLEGIGPVRLLRPQCNDGKGLSGMAEYGLHNSIVR